ncbi:RhuM family protein [Aurantiacibacter sediminis]|uniref:Virulence RhuM family protein n=1 Tax=Aurantiacibacter sediminis TaxID=2793064 RepID=A0ABS0N377_9SPHN|nr:RhuM family protein [Aurantiacibacter sediminis]MBH5321464.1 virulence RhuM family protein [Aurantiacibacter sediminis]
MSDIEPVHLQEDEGTGDHFLVYGDGTGLHVEVNYSGDQLWMTQAQIGSLYGRDISTISRHISNILEEGELEEATSLQKAQTSLGRPATLYSLDMVISVGYRVASKQATLFRKWATEKLVQFATKGFVIDSARLKNPEYRDRLKELKEIIRDIRADEANVYRELRQICAMCQDYDGKSQVWQEFYRNTQAKLVYAVCSDTPAGVIASRADASEPNMGLQSWPNENIRKSDVAISKNYLGEGEVRELNRLTTMLLDMFEDQVELGRLTLMHEVSAFLDSQLKTLGRVVLQHGGRVKMTAAKRHAEQAYATFDKRRKDNRQADADAKITEIKRAAKSLTKKS